MATEVVWSSTDNAGRVVLDRFDLVERASTGRDVIAAAILIRDGELLLGHRCATKMNFPNTWDVVGGHVEQAESPRAALRRELVEELGIDASLGGAWRHIIDDDLGIEMTLWLVTQWAGEVSNCAPHEHDELRWFRHDELSALGFPHHSYFELLGDALSSAAR